ncbi:MAG: COX15/CtaA family protein [Ginsengibacter sp.]
MQNNLIKGYSKNISRWLFAGVAMLMIQVLLGGITRLTESGLSITEWNPVTGALPPLNTAQWVEEFEKYKHTDQFRFIHADFSLSDFKFIFFWEWLHRTWARLMGLVFLIGFFYFLLRKQFRQNMIIPFIILFLLGLMQGAIGWIMVKSGLVPERLFVGHIQLATHFMAALVLLCYTLWFALSLSIPKSLLTVSNSLRKFTLIIIFILIVQLLYGAFMAGLHAATAAPTWPGINGEWIPAHVNDLSPGWKNFIDNKITVQFIHRGLAYILFIAVLIWGYKASKITGKLLFRKTRLIPVLIIFVQVILGIATVIMSPYGNNLVWFGVAHQMFAMLFLMAMVFELYIVRSSRLGVQMA